MNVGAFDELRESGYVRAILSYEDGSYFFYTHFDAYVAPRFELARLDFADMIQRVIDVIGAKNYRGHDPGPEEFLLAKQQQPYRIEWVEE